MPTKVQVTEVSSNSTFANFKSWAGDNTDTTGSPPSTPGTGTGISAALFILGFTKLADTYTAQWDSGTAIGDTARPTAAGSLSGAAFPTTTNNSRTGLLGTAFKGAWVSGTSYTVGQVVTDTTNAALVFINTTATSGTTPPINDPTHWSPYWMEIWKMSGTGSPPLPDIFIKIEYGCTSTQANPDVFIQLGTSYTLNSGVINGGGNFTLCEQVINAAGTQTATEMDFTGDGQNYFGMLLWRNTTSNCFYAFERSISGTVAAAPQYNSSYATYAVCPRTNTQWRSASLMLSGGMATSPRLLGVPTIALQVSSQTLIVSNNTPAFPVFPLVGYVGNPMTVMIGLSATDANEGSSVTPLVYGATHTYLVTSTTFANGLGNGVAGNWALGLRFE